MVGPECCQSGLLQSRDWAYQGLIPSVTWYCSGKGGFVFNVNEDIRLYRVKSAQIECSVNVENKRTLV